MSTSYAHPVRSEQVDAGWFGSLQVTTASNGAETRVFVDAALGLCPDCVARAKQQLRAERGA